MSACSHLDQIKTTNTSVRVCKECVERGDTWVHLRLCLECGHVGCCDDSKNKHATKHFHHTGHPFVRSIEPGESWIWCYGESWIWCYKDNFSPGEIEGREVIETAS